MPEKLFVQPFPILLADRLKAKSRYINRKRRSRLLPVCGGTHQPKDQRQREKADGNRHDPYPHLDIAGLVRLIACFLEIASIYRAIYCLMILGTIRPLPMKDEREDPGFRNQKPGAPRTPRREISPRKNRSERGSSHELPQN